MPYDQGKAEVFNRLYSQGIPKAEALRQAGIEPSSFGNYALGKNGQLGPLVIGTGKVAGVDYDKYTEEEKAEQRRFDAALKDTNYDEKATRAVSQVTPINYNTTSTEVVSGGGSTTIVAGPRQSTRESTAIGQAYDAKNAEYNQFVKDNPSDFARRRQGLPPLTPEERERREARLNELNQEKADLKQAQINAETSGQPTITTVPNTTTTSTTVTTGTTSLNSDVNIQNDPEVFQQAEAQLDASAVPIGSRTSSARSLDANTDLAVAAAPAGDIDIETQAPAPPPQQSVFPTAFDDEGNLSPGFELDENNNPVRVSPDTPPTVFSPQSGLSDEEILARQNPGGLSDEEIQARQPQPVPVPLSDEEIIARQNPGGLSDEEILARQEAAVRDRARQQATFQARYKQPGNADWRVRLSLAPNSQYLYNQKDAVGILAPLAKTDGVIFPYTPNITTAYSAQYEQYDLVHSNYRGLFYKNSRVGDIQIRGTFTAQDTNEADYLLAVIHFFRSATKMFYGQDPERGVPPPVCLLNGFGQYQFSDHPVVISSFNYTLPNDVDYIRAGSPNNYGLNLLNRRAAVASNPGGQSLAGLNRLRNALLRKGAPGQGAPDPNAIQQNVSNTAGATYVPTKMEIDITLIPVQTRTQISKQFSLKGFANGQLLKGGFW